MEFDVADELPHDGAIDEWIFATWVPNGELAIVSGHRLLHDRSWYWAAMVRTDRPLLHLSEWEVVIRTVDPFIVKAPEMWAEHQLDAPFEQWSLGNEAYFVALQDPADAVGRAYGTPTAVAMDLEWYATAAPTAIPAGYEQPGVVHGEIELLHEPNIELVEAPAHRWRRWGDRLDALVTTPKVASTRWMAPFRFPDDSTNVWAMSDEGFRPGPFRSSGEC